MKKIIEITSIKELMEISAMGAGSGGGSVEGYSGTNAFKSDKKEDTIMREELQTEMMMRAYIRGKIKKQLNEQKRRDNEQERQLRLVIRGLIKEAKEMANPHPNTGINKLRDSFRKAKATLKTKYQQLTSTEEQRKTFTSHMLRAFVRLFDELDALQAQGDIESSLEDIESAAGSLGTDTGLQAPPEDQGAKEIEAELDGMLQEVLNEVQIDLEDEGIDVVTDEEAAAEEKERERNKSQAEKDYNKKREKDSEKAEFGGELDGDTTGRNQAFDAFRLVQSYFSDAYLDLANASDQEMYRDWCLFNLKLLFKNFEESLPQSPEEPIIADPEGV
jgi:hypothetical protein